MPNKRRGSVTRMPTLVFDPEPTEIEELRKRRERLGLDRHDEVWEGVLHMLPPPSVQHQALVIGLGALLLAEAQAAALTLTAGVAIGADKDDYREPDLALLRRGFDPQWNHTAALVVEVVSPGDDSWKKLPFYAAHRVEEVVIVDPQERSVKWLGLADDDYRPLERSGLIELGPGELAERVDWP